MTQKRKSGRKAPRGRVAGGHGSEKWHKKPRAREQLGVQEENSAEKAAREGEARGERGAGRNKEISHYVTLRLSVDILNSK